MLRAEEVTKRFGGHVVLAGIKLSVTQGEILGLLGPNGSGKTTLLNLLSGFARMDAGRVEFLGHSIAGLSSHQISQVGLRRTFQMPAMPGRMTCAELLLTRPC